MNKKRTLLLGSILFSSILLSLLTISCKETKDQKNLRDINNEIIKKRKNLKNMKKNISKARKLHLMILNNLKFLKSML